MTCGSRLLWRPPWVPVTEPSTSGTRDETDTIVRLKPGVTSNRPERRSVRCGKRLAAAYPATNRGVDLTVTPLWQGHLGAQGMLLQPLRILMALSLLFLLIVCANVSNLLSRAPSPAEREFGVRLALGAGVSG